MTAYFTFVASFIASTVGTSPSPAWRWSRVLELNFGEPGAKGFDGGLMPSLTWIATRRSPSSFTRETTSWPATSAQYRSSSIATDGSTRSEERSVGNEWIYIMQHV